MSTRNKEEIIHDCLIKQIQDLEQAVEIYKREAIESANFPAKVYKKLFPKSIDGPDGKWFPMDERYTEVMLEEIGRIRKGGKPE